MVFWCWDWRQWQIDFRRLDGLSVAGVPTRKGWFVSFGPGAVAVYERGST